MGQPSYLVVPVVHFVLIAVLLRLFEVELELFAVFLNPKPKPFLWMHADTITMPIFDNQFWIKPNNPTFW